MWATVAPAPQTSARSAPAATGTDLYGSNQSNLESRIAKHDTNPARATMDDAAIDEIAARLNLILGDLVDDVTFNDLVNAVAGITQ